MKAPAGRDRLWGMEQTADYLDVPVNTLRRWLTEGVGPRSYKVGKYRRFKPTEVDAWLETRVVEAA